MKFSYIPLLFIALLIIVNSTYAADTYSRLTIDTSAPNNQKTEIIYLLPNVTFNDTKKKQCLLVLFGGRNWLGEKALDTYHFDELADQYHIVLLSPSFKDDDYWRPEEWSGEVLLAAIKEIEQKHNLTLSEWYYYGYLGGGQCANLFYFLKPEKVRAVAIHACVVWDESLQSAENKAPFLITCGQEDSDRYIISYTAVQRMRESGRPVIFWDYGGGHELNPEALNLAHAFFTAQFEGKTAPVKIAEDNLRELYDPNESAAKRIDPEFANIFTSDNLAKLWQLEQADGGK
jgi:poly(3-hydroxybutyrate) depolymerase